MSLNSISVKYIIFVSNIASMKEVNGFNGLYSIDEAGNVYSQRKHRGLKHHDNGIGYKQVYLTDQDGHGKWYKVHRLVLLHFGPTQPTDKHEPNHIDHNKANNHIDNLHWCTRSENIKLSYSYGNRRRLTKSGHTHTQETIRKMKEAKQKPINIRLNNQLVYTSDSVQDAANFLGVTTRTVHRMLNAYITNGYKLSYV